MKDVKKRAEWRDSWKGKVCLWIFNYWQLIGILVVFMTLGVVYE